MGKKSARQVATAVSVTPPVKSAKKGKRNADATLEKLVNAKKQKIAKQKLLKKQNKEAKTGKKKETSSFEDTSSLDSEEEAPPVKVSAPAKRQSVRTDATAPKKTASEDDEIEDESSEDIDEEPQRKKIKVPSAVDVGKPNVNALKKASNSEEESVEESSDDEPSKAQQVKKPIEAPKESSSSEDGLSEEESEEEEPAKTTEEKSTKASKESSNFEDFSSEEESEEEQPVKTPKNNRITPATPNVQTTGAKTLFMGNLSFSIERTDVEEFFKDMGEVVDVRLSLRDGKFKGYGHVEFATEGAAKKALELNGQDLLGRPVKLDIARERGTPNASKESNSYSKESNSYQKGGKDQVRTIFVRGFDTSMGEDQIRSTLEEHFESCGEISRVSIPKDYDTGGPKGIAYIDFPNGDSLSKALELNGCELGGSSLVVEEARPKADNRDGGGSGRGGGGRSGSRDSGGRFGGRRGGGRSGGRGGRSGRGGRGGRFGRGGRGR